MRTAVSTWLELLVEQAGSHDFRVTETGKLAARIKASLDGEVLTVAYYLADAEEPAEVERYRVTPIAAEARSDDRAVR